MSDNKNMNSKNFSKAINNMIVSGYDKLESVGCYLDSDVGSVYPIYIENGEEKCDYNLEISLYEDEVSLDWIESLSPEDYEKCKVWLT
jgi:hypothetical protein|tara:strand:+ start:326 stop:589 length:264 start_codon:yes stop_codon:yes gene_type:complete